MRNTMLKRLGTVLLGATAVLGTVGMPGASAATTASTCPTPTPAPVRIATNAPIASGTRMTSGDTALVMQTDGNLVQYLVRPDCQNGPALWSSNTSGNAGAYAIMQPDGNFVVYKAGGSSTLGGALWSAQTNGWSGVTASFDHGALRLHGGLSGVIWQDVAGFLPTHDASGNPLVQVSSDLLTNYKMAGGSWAESSSVWLVEQNDGNLVIYRKRDGAALWSTGTYGHAGAYADISSAGNLEVVQNGSQIWKNATGQAANAHVLVQDDANVVLYRQGMTDSADALWSTQTNGMG
jgi:hypothetical protein